MSGTTRWSEPDTLKLIKLYKSYEFLWDRNTELYKNIFARKQAYEAIVTEMNLPGITAQDVRCKIKNLRTSYYQELRKMASMRMKNKPIRPLKWFLSFKSIMGNHTLDDRPQITKSTMSETTDAVEPGEINSESEVEEEEEEEEEEDPAVQEDESYFVEDPTSNSDLYVVSIKQEFLDEMENLGDKTMPPTLSDYLEPVQGNQNQQQRNKKKDEEVPMKKSKKLDEFQIFANNIAQQLRKMPLSRALKMQIDVQAMIAKERIEAERLKKRDDNQEDSS